MSKKYFLLDEIVEEYDLIAIHTSLDDFSVAFVLNKNLRANFKRVKESLRYKNSTFEMFHWKNLKEGVNCSLISNKNFVDSGIKNESNSLFNLSETKKVSLINSLSNVDYLLKIKEGIEIEQTIKILNKLPQLILSYVVDNKEVKSNFNLILD
jgi:hypothetical protein